MQEVTISIKKFNLFFLTFFAFLLHIYIIPIVTSILLCSVNGAINAYIFAAFFFSFPHILAYAWWNCNLGVFIVSAFFSLFKKKSCAIFFWYNFFLKELRGKNKIYEKRNKILIMSYHRKLALLITNQENACSSCDWINFKLSELSEN